MIYLAGKTITGTETRAKTLNYDAIAKVVGINMYPGTFNVQCLESPPYQDMGYIRVIGQNMFLYPCVISTKGMIEKGKTAVPGWIIKIPGEGLPSFFVEIVSAFRLRKELKIEKWPSIPVEIGINLPTNGTKEQ